MLASHLQRDDITWDEVWSCPSVSLSLLHLIYNIPLSLPYVPRHRGAGASCGLRTSVVLTGTPVIVVRSSWHHMCWTFVWCYHLFAWRCSKLQLGSQSELTVACACMFGLFNYCLYATCKHPECLNCSVTLCRQCTHMSGSEIKQILPVGTVYWSKMESY